MRNEPLARVLDRLASSDPTPGGGAAAALAGALAASLLAMVARLSRGKGGDDAAFERAVASMDAARVELLDLAEKDSHAFNAVMSALRLPRGSDDAKRRRQLAVQAALKEASEVPLVVATRTLEVLETAPLVARSGNPTAISDVGAGVLLAHGAVHGALLNVRINLASIKDDTYRAATSQRVRDISRQSDQLRDEVMAAVNERIPSFGAAQDRPRQGSGQA